MCFFTWTVGSEKKGADFKNSVKGDSMHLQGWVDERKEEIYG